MKRRNTRGQLPLPGLPTAELTQSDRALLIQTLGQLLREAVMGEQELAEGNCDEYKDYR